MNDLLIKILDVEYGLVIYIKIPNDKNIVYDLGKVLCGEVSEFSSLNYIKRYCNFDTIDYFS